LLELRNAYDDGPKASFTLCKRMVIEGGGESIIVVVVVVVVEER
jgi:hypothetical protein